MFDNMSKTVDTRVPVLDGTLTLAIKIWYPAENVQFETSTSTNTTNSISSYPRRCLAYPGWLDNVGSFENIAPILCERLKMTLAVIDPPGCGWSDHRAAESPYADYEEPPLIGDVADALGWKTFGLIGHSRGGAICAYAAALFADRILFLVAFDSGLGLSGVWTKDLKPGAPTPVQRMRLAREQHKRNHQRKARVFATLEEAITANATNDMFKKSTSTARNIVLRHLRPHPSGGYSFTHDGRTYGQSQYVCLAEEQTRSFLREIQCPVLKINAKPDAIRYDPELRSYFEDRHRCVKYLDQVVVEGSHHVHSDDAPATAEAVIAWFEKADRFSTSHISKAKL